jgi:hypothetical protein
VKSKLVALGCCWLVGATAGLGQPSTAADDWLAGPVQFPWVSSNSPGSAATFTNLHADLLGGKLRVLWPAEQPATNVSATLWSSADKPGRWAARDWRPYAMAWRGSGWESTVPVDDVDVPLVYFVEVREDPSLHAKPATAATQVSPMRICRPRVLGLEEPTRIFWPFLEGFEQGAESWRLLAPTPETPALALASEGKSGLAALRVRLPAQRHSVTVATTRVRGWQLRQQSAAGFRLWLRTGRGAGSARFTLFANAFATTQVASVCRTDTKLGEKWQKVDLALAEFPKVPLDDVDLVAIEFIGDGPQEFFIDDLQLLGPWKPEPE